MMYVFPTIPTRHMNLFLIWHKDGLLADRGLNNLAGRVRFIILQLLFAGSIAQIIDYLVGILRSWVPDPRVMTPFIVNLDLPTFYRSHDKHPAMALDYQTLGVVGD